MKNYSLTAFVSILALGGCTAQLSVPYRIELAIQGKSRPILSQCTAYTVATTDGKNAPISSNFTVVSETGAIYSDLNHCLKNSPATAILFPQGLSSQKFYYRNTSVGNDSLEIAGAGNVGSISVSVIRQNFNAGTGFDQVANSILIDPENDYRMYVSGDFTSYNGVPVSRIVRLLQDGTLDPTFQPGTGPDGHASTIRFMGDGSGRIYLFGNFTTYNGVPSGGVARILPSGALDSTFNVQAGFNSNVQRGVVLNDGSYSIYACGMFSSYRGISSPGIARVKQDGSLDPTFSIGSGIADQCSGMVLTADNSQNVYASYFVPVSYNGSSSQILFKIKRDGSLDAGFMSNAALTGNLWGLSPSTDGTNRIFFDGTSISFSGTPLPTGVGSLNSDGTKDAAFSPTTGTSGVFFDVVQIADGSLFGVGLFSDFNGTAQGNFVKLTPTGAVDTSFITSPGFNTMTYLPAPAFDGTGKVYVIGPFTNYGPKNAGSIIRLNPDGTSE